MNAIKILINETKHLNLHIVLLKLIITLVDIGT